MPKVNSLLCALLLASLLGNVLQLFVQPEPSASISYRNGALALDPIPSTRWR